MLAARLLALAFGALALAAVKVALNF